MGEFHFIRPLWLLGFLPLIGAAWLLLRQKPILQAWKDICDAHLLQHLMQKKAHSKRPHALLLLLISAFCMVFSLAGPTWSRLPVPTYQYLQPRLLVLDMSANMLAKDLPPNRLSRAKFKLHDLLNHQQAGQFGLVVYSSEPFIVSPLTNDSKTIASLLPALTPDIMPVEGQRLDLAIKQAADLITQAGFHRGSILVLTGEPPSPAALGEARTLARQGIRTSVLPLLQGETGSPMFQKFADAGDGFLIPFTETSKDVDQWIKASAGEPQFKENLQNEVPVWRDEGRWFLIPALLLLLPAFRRGWLQRIST